jgi:hypothetical protein
MCSLALIISCTLGAVATDDVELSFDIWDWTAPCKDIVLFDTWVADLVAMGFTRVEISVPWRVVEPEPNQIDLRWLEERLAVCKRHKVGMRLRINSYYGGAVPDWYEGAFWQAETGPIDHQKIPSITDERFWQHYGPLCTAIAATCRGEDVLFNAFIGVHAELKWADWWHYDETTMALWRQVIQQPRPDWLRDVVDNDSALPERPSVPQATHGLPDLSPESRAVIAFREWVWREAVRRFTEAIRQGNPDAVISAPLGESYRIGSAQMSNLDYWGLSRGASQVVHSYDFFQHGDDGAWEAGASVAAFRGITGLPVSFEYDSEQSTLGLGYSGPHLLALGHHAARAGAGLKVANYSYLKELPSQKELLPQLVRQWRSSPSQTPPLKAETVLLFFSKWTNYSYREPEGQHGFGWVHDAQFGVYKLFMDLGIPTRIICEDNLDENLSGYRAIFMALSPEALMPRSAREKLATLFLPRIDDYLDIPPLQSAATPQQADGLATVTITSSQAPIGLADLSGLDGYEYAINAGNLQLAAYQPGHVVFGYPIGLIYQNDPQPYTHQGLVLWALQQVATAN